MKHIAMLLSLLAVALGHTSSLGETLPTKNTKTMVATSFSHDSKQEALNLVKEEVAAANEMCPQEAGFGMVLTKVVLEGDYVVYEYVCDESKLSIDQMLNNKETKPLLKDNVSTLAKHNSNLAVFLAACKKANKGLEYIYIGSSSGKKCIIKLSPSEL